MRSDSFNDAEEVSLYALRKSSPLHPFRLRSVLQQVHIVHYPCTSDGSLTGLDDTTDYSRPSACTPCSVVQIGRNRCSMIRYPAGDEHVTTSPCSMFPQSEKTRKCSLQDGWPFRKVEVDISRKVVRYTKCHFSYEGKAITNLLSYVISLLRRIDKRNNR